MVRASYTAGDRSGHQLHRDVVHRHGRPPSRVGLHLPVGSTEPDGRFEPAPPGTKEDASSSWSTRTLASALKTELNQLFADLAGDGWTVSRHDVPRHDDQAWQAGPVNSGYRSRRFPYQVDRRRRLCVRHWPNQGCVVMATSPSRTQATGLKTVIPIMLVPGQQTPYYGDLEGNWTDVAAGPSSAMQNPLLRNVPGDGKFDQSVFPEPGRTNAVSRSPGLDLAVGRIDFAGLPAFRPSSERDLLRRTRGTTAATVTETTHVSAPRTRRRLFR